MPYKVSYVKLVLGQAPIPVGCHILVPHQPKRYYRWRLVGIAGASSMPSTTASPELPRVCFTRSVKMAWSIVSNAGDKSSKISAATRPLPSVWRVLFLFCFKTVSVERYFLQTATGRRDCFLASVARREYQRLSSLFCTRMAGLTLVGSCLVCLDQEMASPVEV